MRNALADFSEELSDADNPSFVTHALKRWRRGEETESRGFSRPADFGFGVSDALDRATRTAFRHDHADAPRCSSRALPSLPRRHRRYRSRRRDPDGKEAGEDVKERYGSRECFFSLGFGSRAARRSATSWMKTHTHSDSLRFPVIEKTVKPPTRGARADAARLERLVSPRRLVTRDALERERKRRLSPVMKLQKGVSQKHHSQCPNFRVLLPDSSGCPVEN